MTVAIKQLSLSALESLDGGKGDLAFQACLKRAAKDCEDRPSDDKVRVVTLQIELTPVLEADLTCTEVKAKIKCAAKLPPFRTKEYSVGLRRNGMLVFNEDSPDNVNQETLGYGDEE